MALHPRAALVLSLIVLSAASREASAQQVEFGARRAFGTAERPVRIAINDQGLQVTVIGSDAAFFAYRLLQCAAYEPVDEPLPWIGPLDLLKSMVKKTKNVVAKDTVDHWFRVRTRTGETLHLKVADVHVSAMRARLQNAGLATCGIQALNAPAEPAQGAFAS